MGKREWGYSPWLRLNLAQRAETPARWTESTHHSGVREDCCLFSGNMDEKAGTGRGLAPQGWNACGGRY